MYAVVKNARIYFDVDGEGSTPAGAAMVEKPTLMVLHGGPGSDHSYFKPWIRPLTEVAQVIYVDHRGNGRSELTGPATYNIDQIVDDLEALRRLLGLGRVQLLGHSFGGMVALTFALRHPGSLEALLLCTTTAGGKILREDAWAVAERLATPEQMAVLATLFDGQLKSDEEHEEWWRVCLPLPSVTAAEVPPGPDGAAMVADILRLLHGGDQYSVISVDLCSPSSINAVPNRAPGEYSAPAYTLTSGAGA